MAGRSTEYRALVFVARPNPVVHNTGMQNLWNTVKILGVLGLIIAIPIRMSWGWEMALYMVAGIVLLLSILSGPGDDDD